MPTNIQTTSTTPLIDGQYALISTNSRNIGGLIPDVTIEEVSTDILRVTEHPVEVGASISDHAYHQPSDLMMRCGWSDSDKNGYNGYVNAVYDKFLNLQATREPFNVSTGKRYYSNMLITLLHMVNVDQTAHGLFLTIGMRVVDITNTESTAFVNPASLTNPESTVSPANQGIAQLALTPSTTPNVFLPPGIGVTSP